MTFSEINYSLGATTVFVKVDVVFISVKYFQVSLPLMLKSSIFPKAWPYNPAETGSKIIPGQYLVRKAKSQPPISKQVFLLVENPCHSFL